MRIVQVGPFPTDINCIKGGVESSVYGLAIALSQEHEVIVIDVPRLGYKDTKEQIGNVTILRYANTGKYNQDAIKRDKDIVNDIKALHPDVVHIHGTGAISATLYYKLKDQFKVLLTVHGILHVEKTNSLRKKFTLKALYQYFYQSRIEFNLLSKVGKIIVDTEYVAVQLRKLYEQKKIKHLPEMYVIPQGINEAYLYIDAIKESNNILSVGTISERKGHIHLVKAFELFCEQDTTTQLIIAGVVSDTNYYNQLRAYIDKSPYKDRITLHTNLQQEELFALYKDAKVFVLHSQEESQGIVFAEAMALGLPVVATNVGGVPYVVKNNVNGLLSDYADVASFAQNLSKLLLDPEMCVAMSQRNKKEAINYKWSTIANKIVDLYGKL